MKPMTLFCLFLVVMACEDEKSTEPTEITTDGGWDYLYLNLPQKKNGWKISISANSPWNAQKHNAWAAVLAPYMLQYSGYGDVTPADKAALFEDLHSNAMIYQTSSQVTTELYVETGEEDAFFEAITAMFEDYSLDPDYFEEIKGQILESVEEAEAQKNSEYVMERIMSYAMFEQNNDVITPYDQSSENLEALTIDDVNDWIDHVKSLSGFMIGVAGAENPETLNPYIDELLNGFSQEKEGYQIEPLNPPNRIMRIAFENPELEKTNISWTAKWPDIASSEEFVPLDYASYILDGDSTKTRLASIREELRASYGFASYYFSLDINHYLLGISGESDVEHQADVLARIAKVNQSMIDEKPTEKEFEAAKSTITSYYDESYKDENVAAFAMSFAQNPSYKGQWLDEKQIYEDADLDTIAAKIAQIYPKDDAWMQVIVTPDASNIDADCVISEWRDVSSCFE